MDNEDLDYDEQVNQWERLRDYGLEAETTN